MWIGIVDRSDKGLINSVISVDYIPQIGSEFYKSSISKYAPHLTVKVCRVVNGPPRDVYAKMFDVSGLMGDIISAIVYVHDGYF